MGSKGKWYCKQCDWLHDKTHTNCTGCSRKKDVVIEPDKKELIDAKKLSMTPHTRC